MIAGVLLRNYKYFYGINYIELLNNTSNLTFLIGDNGVGKSTILEALNTFFNKEEWKVNNKAYRDKQDKRKAYIAPFFLINKELVDKQSISLLQQISDFVINDLCDNRSIQKNYKFLINHIEKLKKIFSEDKYFFIIVSISNTTSYDEVDFFEDFLNTFYNKIKNDDNDKNFNLLHLIRKIYNYVYVPVDINIETFTKIENKNMELLTGKNIRKEIEKAVGNDTLKSINNHLEFFLDEVSKNLKNYIYKNPSRRRISMNELVNEIIKLFFSIRTLHKKSEKKYKEISINELSSGEKKYAIIEIIKAFLEKNELLEEAFLILAVDEPEASLNISKKFEQFENIFDLSKFKNIQVLITSHWYGFIPISENGNLFYLKENDNENYFDLYKYREDIKHKTKENYIRNILPLDISLKSFNDLVQSIIQSIVLNDYKWIICEGRSEKIYFNKFFEHEVLNEKFKVLPMGGNQEVIKLIEYLLFVFNKDKYLSKEIKGKIFALIDTDENIINYDPYIKNIYNNFKDNIVLKRLYLDINNDEVVLLEYYDTRYGQKTEIEDSLFLNDSIKTLNLIASCTLNNEIIQYKDKFYYFGSIKLKLTTEQYHKIKDWFNKDNGNNKILFAKKYIENISENNLNWIKEIKGFLKVKNENS